MLPSTSATWTVRGASFALWALAAGSVVFWGLKLGGSSRAANAPPLPARAVAAADPAAIERLLGGSPAALVAAAPVPTLASRFHLVGVAAGARSGLGAAIIAVDGKPGRPYRVGSVVDEGLVLQSVQGRQATLGPVNGPAAVTLELPSAAANPGQAASAAPR
ncbi:MAG TPA: type II secretion system protein N [Ramlibacter sp.]|uniref:type II secretion system protein N n=1 Tax=Ramlibacter sp. TaxID=1917967 RepID=UPI002ED144A7